MIASDAPITEPFRRNAVFSPRRDDVEFKQAKIARLLADTECESALLLERANVRWLTSGAADRGVYHAEECPAILANAGQRWVICSHVDTQRLFDEELNGLGFQVKEWPGTIHREQFLADLCHGRQMAVDQPFRDFKFVGPYLAQERRILSSFEQDRLRTLGSSLIHALEATARNLQRGDSEEEIAGHLAHRLLKRGVEPVVLSIAADDRGRHYRRPGFTSAAVGVRCLLQATACKYGLFASASRTVCFGPPNERLKQELECASKLLAVWQAAVKAGDRPASLYDAARGLLRDTPYEHELRLAAPGWWTARTPSELLFTPASQERFLENQALVWQARIGGVAVCETYSVKENGIFPITPVEDWPFRRYVIQGTRFDIPDLLIRKTS